MPESRRASIAPWISAAVAGVVLVALLLAYFLFLRDDMKAVVGELTTSEKAAITAAGTEAANLITYSRAHFDQDYQRAIDGTTGALRTDVVGKRTVTKQTITSGKFDASGVVTHAALVGPSEKNKTNGYVVLVTINGFRSTAKDVPIQQNLQMTMVQVKGKWLAADVTNVAVS
ncbi:MAG: hypothetical protein QOG01_3414 [Pseudonocardiales bacterium]|jgi:hypothetical protein|nr:hypothetical protein [Pseudonocardiales bacterium]